MEALSLALFEIMVVVGVLLVLVWSLLLVLVVFVLVYLVNFTSTLKLTCPFGFAHTQMGSLEENERESLSNS